MKKIGIFSYPKSGNTWLRFLLANLLYPNEYIDYTNINKYVPTDSGENVPKNEFQISVYKSHHQLNKKSTSKFDKIIYLRRNGKDVAKSYYSFIQAQNPKLIDNELEFIKIHSAYYGSWGKHIESALNFRDKPTLNLDYDEFQSNIEQYMYMICDFLEINIAQRIIKSSIEKCSKENMKNLGGSLKFIQSNGRHEDYNFVGVTKRKNLNIKTLSLWYQIGINGQIMKEYYNESIPKLKNNSSIEYAALLFKIFYLIRLKIRKLAISKK